MKNYTTIEVFGMTKTEALKKGTEIRHRFFDHLDRALKSTSGENFPHCYFYSPPGIGKTFSIKGYFELTGTKYIEVTDNTSMFAFGIKLAVINFLNTNKERVIVFVDDCDSLFSSETSCNIMKNVLDGSKVFNYEKSLQSQWSNLSPIQKEALEQHQDNNCMGFKVPTENMQFIFASNFQLPFDDEVEISKHKGNKKSIMSAHRNAIRSRCMVGDYDLYGAELFGWLADVTLNTELLTPVSFDLKQKLEILDFIWSNWPILKERSLRSIKKMGELMVNHPEKYFTYWNIDFKIKK